MQYSESGRLKRGGEKHMTFRRRLATAIATGALVLNSFATSAFAATVEISGNGSDSDNDAYIDLKKTNSIAQYNDAYIDNNVDVKASTGGNDANDNTGGDVNVDTGDSDVAVSVANLLNKNSAAIACCESGDTSVKIAGNGHKSDNKVDLDLDSENEIYQENDADVDNDVDVDAETGDNEANDNTGGDVEVDTGNSKVGVSLLTLANMNLAQIGGGDDEEGGSLSLWILDNGSDSDNEIDANIDSENSVAQYNDADVDNDVDVDADTGDNDANDNTGGEVSIDTGNAEVEVEVANALNFNWADLSCGCLFDDLTAKISGNGSDSDNKIDLDVEENDEKEATVYQDNKADVDNDLKDLEAETGNNDAEDNTGESEGGDPSIDTGDAGVEASVVNEANQNGAAIGDFEFEFDWEELLEDLLG
jgi:hypothetical protein